MINFTLKFSYTQTKTNLVDRNGLGLKLWFLGNVVNPALLIFGILPCY